MWLLQLLLLVLYAVFIHRGKWSSLYMKLKNDWSLLKLKTSSGLNSLIVPVEIRDWKVREISWTKKSVLVVSTAVSVQRSDMPKTDVPVVNGLTAYSRSQEKAEKAAYSWNVPKRRKLNAVFYATIFHVKHITIQNMQSTLNKLWTCGKSSEKLD